MPIRRQSRLLQQPLGDHVRRALGRRRAGTTQYGRQAPAGIQIGSGSPTARKSVPLYWGVLMRDNACLLGRRSGAALYLRVLMRDGAGLLGREGAGVSGPSNNRSGVRARDV